ncbi:MAG: hypothetical protein ACI3ZG_04270 [Candidatus Coprenecus sp.]
MSEIIKYKNSEILFQSVQSNNEPEAVRNMMEELNSFETEVSLLLDDMAQVDKSIADFRLKCDEIANSINNLGSLANIIAKDNASQVKGAVALVAAATKLYGLFSSKQKENRARKEFYAKQDAILQKKQEIASEKLPAITSQLEKFKVNIAVKIEELYSKDWDKVLDMSDSLMKPTVTLFKRNFSLAIKMRYLVEVMQYCIYEMQSWSKGKQNSSMDSPSVVNLIESEFASWPNRLGYKKGAWNDLMIDALNQEKGKIPVPVAMVISDPCLMRHFIGVNIGKSDNCPNALILLNDKIFTCPNPLAAENLYLVHCKNILSNSYNPPKDVMGVSLLDYLIILSVPVMFFGILVLIFFIESSAFWRIFFILPTLCWLGYAIELLETQYDKVFPYVKRIKKYNSEVDNFMKDVKKMEDCKEYHII